MTPTYRKRVHLKTQQNICHFKIMEKLFITNLFSITGIKTLNVLKKIIQITIITIITLYKCKACAKRENDTIVN